MTKHFQVSGMGCSSCIAKITRAIAALDPGAAVAVDLAAGTVTVESSEPAETLRSEIEALGFEARYQA